MNPHELAFSGTAVVAEFFDVADVLEAVAVAVVVSGGSHGLLVLVEWLRRATTTAHRAS